MLTPDGDRAVLMDLGLAQIADESEGRLTRTRQFVGTLRYASPEQVLSVPLDARSDIYSLGATLWELLTLQPLFGATEQTPTPELMVKIQSTDPAPPRRINPEIPEDLEAIVIKCLEKDRARRYATAQDLADDLSRWQRGEPVQAQPPTLRYLVGRYVQRHRAKLATIAATVLVAFVSLAGLGIYAELQRREAVAHRNVAVENEGKAEARRQEAEIAQRAAEAEKAKAEAATEAEVRQRERAEQQLYLSNIYRATGELESGRHAGAAAILETIPIPSRRWESRYLMRQATGTPLTLHGHEEAVSGVAFSPDGRRIVSGSGDKTLKVWDAETGTETLTLRGHERRVRDVAFSPDGGRIVSADLHGHELVWDVETGQPAQEARRPATIPNSNMSPDGLVLAIMHGLAVQLVYSNPDINLWAEDAARRAAWELVWCIKDAEDCKRDKD